MDQKGADKDGRFTGSCTLCVLMHFVSRKAGLRANPRLHRTCFHARTSAELLIAVKLEKAYSTRSF